MSRRSKLVLAAKKGRHETSANRRRSDHRPSYLAAKIANVPAAPHPAFVFVSTLGRIPDSRLRTKCTTNILDLDCPIPTETVALWGDRTLSVEKGHNWRGNLHHRGERSRLK